MILILSIHGEISTDEVIDWLVYYNIPFYRLNSEDLLTNTKVKFFLNNNNSSLGNSSIGFSFTDKNNVTLNSKDIKVVWFRKFGFYKNSDSYKILSEKYGENIAAQSSDEFYSTIHLIYNALGNKKWLTHYKSISPSKFNVLAIANECGLRIPKSIVTNNKENFDLQSISLMKDKFCRFV